MGRQRPATCREILLAIRTRLVAATSLDDAQVGVFAGDPEDAPHHLAGQDVLLCPREEPIGEGDAGGGRYTGLRVRHLDIAVRTRLWVDNPDSDLARLTDVSLGHFVVEDLVADALHLWLPVAAADEPGDLDGIAMPLECGTFSAPRRSHSAKGWVISTLAVTFAYQRDFTLPEIS